jgi:hypothetical protein
MQARVAFVQEREALVQRTGGARAGANGAHAGANGADDSRGGMRPSVDRDVSFGDEGFAQEVEGSAPPWESCTPLAPAHTHGRKGESAFDEGA